MKKAILFDMDMTLVDSRPAIKRAMNIYFEPYGVSTNDIVYESFIGMVETVIFRAMCEKAGIEYTDDIGKAIFGIYHDVAPEMVRAFDGSLALLDALRDDGRKMVLSTSTVRSKMLDNMNAAGLPLTYFDAAICGEDVQNAKPAPDIFLKSAQIIDTPPRECIVLEDALHGVSAAKAAGMACVAITFSFDAKSLTDAGADAIINSLDEAHDTFRTLDDIS